MGQASAGGTEGEGGGMGQVSVGGKDEEVVRAAWGFAKDRIFEFAGVGGSNYFLCRSRTRHL